MFDHVLLVFHQMFICIKPSKTLDFQLKGRLCPLSLRSFSFMNVLVVVVTQLSTYIQDILRGTSDNSRYFKRSYYGSYFHIVSCLGSVMKTLVETNQ